jgi:VWFA-related protein
MLPRLIFIGAAWNLFAQEPVIRLDVQHVLVPVVVTDKKGHHVSGLRASDFRISEDGVQQEIASFSSDTAGAVDDIAALSKPTSAAGPRHTFVICIDTLHASSANAARLREALENLFEKEKPADAQYVLIAIGRQLQVLQAATPSPLAILLKLRSTAFQNAMGGLDASALSAQLQTLRSHMNEFCKHCACGTRSSQGSCNSEIDTLKQSIDADAERWSGPTNGLLEQFKNVVGELAKLPTSRTLILVSDGFNTNPKHEFYQVVSAYLPNVPQFKLDDSKDVEPSLGEALKIATERGVIIDTVDSRGSATASLASTGSMDASAPSGTSGDYSMLGTNRSATRSPRNVAAQNADPKTNSFASQESASMEQLARATGGVYFHDSGDLLKQFRGALADGRQYYLLSYVPKNPAHDGKFRTIRVETIDTKLTVRAKSGYWAAQ